MDVGMFFAGVGGFLVGMFACSRALRWALSVRTVIKEQQRDPTKRSLWRIAGVALLHSGLWTCATLIVLSFVILPAAHAPEWNAFFYGTLMGVALQGSVVLWFMRKMRGIRVGATLQDKSGALLQDKNGLITPERKPESTKAGIYTPTSHRILLFACAFSCGILSSVIYYKLEAPTIAGPFPLFLIIANAVIGFAGGLLMGECIWRVNKYIDLS